MASCCSFTDLATTHFGQKAAEKTLARYLRKGPDDTTRLLRERLAAERLVSEKLFSTSERVWVSSASSC